MLDVIGIGQSIDQPIGNLLTLRQVNDLNRFTVQGEREQQDFKIIRRHITLRPGLFDVNTGIGLQVNAQVVCHLLPPFHKKPRMTPDYSITRHLRGAVVACHRRHASSIYAIRGCIMDIYVSFIITVNASRFGVNRPYSPVAAMCQRIFCGV